VEYFLSDYSNNNLNVFAFFGDAGVTYLVKCREYPLSVQKETTERGIDRKKSVTDIHQMQKRLNCCLNNQKESIPRNF
jgi:hypothetical protein